MKRTSDTLNGMNTIIASISGENVSEKKCRKRLARKLDLLYSPYKRWKKNPYQSFDF